MKKKTPKISQFKASLKYPTLLNWAPVKESHKLTAFVLQEGRTRAQSHPNHSRIKGQQCQQLTV